MSSLKLKGTLWVENERGQLIGPGRKKLLEAIQSTGSIKSAAKKMKMSYRHAWEMANNMSKCYAKPLFKKTAGGVNGGGTRLTTEGQKLITMYEILFKEFEKFKNELNKTI